MWIIGYGSLMNREQFEGKEHRLVIVKGWKRVFNKVVSRPVWKQYARGDELGTLNVIQSQSSHFNAVAHRVSDEEFSKLIEREEDYHREKAGAYDFKTHEKLGDYTLFVSNTTNKQGDTLIRDDIKPINEYLEVSRRGAYSWGDDFGEEFDRTTFLADGRVCIKEFLKL